MFHIDTPSYSVGDAITYKTQMRVYSVGTGLTLRAQNDAANSHAPTSHIVLQEISV